MVFRFSWLDLRIVLHDVGEVFFWSSFGFLVPVPLVFFYGESFWFFLAYFLTAFCCFFFGLALRSFFSSETETQLKHAFLSVSFVWLFFSFFAALPFVLIQGTSFLDGAFESMSALTTTGLSVLDEELDSVPKSLVFWRSFLGWVGGLGIIVLALIGIVSAYSTSSRLFFAEGRDDSIKPNLKHTVKELWKIYCVLTFVGFVLLLFAGMGFFDALNYSMSSVSTSGFNTRADKLALAPNFFAEIIITFLLVLGATNFSLHYFFVKKRSFRPYFQSTEFKAMVFFSLIGGLLVFPKIALLVPGMLDALRVSFFHSFSAQLGGHTAVLPNFFSLLDDFSILVFVVLMIVGGSSGSTSGGIKISRFLLVLKQVYWKIREISLPKNSFFSKKFEGIEVDQKKLSEINQFVLIYFGLLLLGTIVFTLHSFSLSHSLLEVASAQGNAGLSIGITQKGMPVIIEITLFFLMWAGRLDILPLFSLVGVLLSLKPKKKSL